MRGSLSVHTALSSWDTIQILHHRSHLGRLNLSLSPSLSLPYPSLSPPSIPPSLPPSLPPSHPACSPSLSTLPLRRGQRTGKEAWVCGGLFQCEGTSCLCLVPWQDRPQRWGQGRVGVCSAACLVFFQVSIREDEWGWMRQRWDEHERWDTAESECWDVCT